MYPCSGSDQLTHNLDAWHRQALGKSAHSVWRALLTRGELTREEIAEATGRTRWTVGRALDKLRAHGLAEPIGLRWAAEPTNAEGLRRIAVACGTLGKAERRRAKYAEARAIRAGELIRRQKASWEKANYDRQITANGRTRYRQSLPPMAARDGEGKGQTQWANMLKR